ncbi:MAG: universal stress protein [Frankiaceae bacterium]|nr:universal stress protein [Frankiaceae bacterium]
MDANRERIVVGVDGSPASVEALRWANDQARLTGAPVEAVIAWFYPISYGFPVIADIDWAREAEVILSRVVKEAVGDDDALISQRAIEGHPTRVLDDLSQEAAMLVVGPRGHGGFAGLVLGSVTTHVIGHAGCPVVVVRMHALEARTA